MSERDINTVRPYEDSELSKREQIEGMFNNIAHRYDFLNHFLSLGIDYSWRKKVVQILKTDQPKEILDVATGTADLAIALASLKPDTIIGVDIADKMLDLGRDKIARKGLSNLINLQNGDSERLPFSHERFDAVTVAFGVRNFEHLDIGLAEIRRVLKENGKLIVLEFSKPTAFPIKQFYQLYSRYILPLMGRAISSDSKAYTYLPDSVAAFPDGLNFLSHLEQCGYQELSYQRLSGGIVTIYVAVKK